MYKFEKTDDGYKVENADGRVVCRVQTSVPQDNPIKDKSGKVLEIESVQKPLDKDKWLFHFTGWKMTPAEVTALLSEASGQS